MVTGNDLVCCISENPGVFATVYMTCIRRVFSVFFKFLVNIARERDGAEAVSELGPHCLVIMLGWAPGHCFLTNLCIVITPTF
jgi:hypothetical protein